jgi:hypothetical protein
MLASHLRGALPAKSRHDCTPFKKCPADSSGQQGSILQM